ncbi:unnamed protein product [marine sediment metagenome]|uniref:ParB/Sulfiredoxin domain-containing protein n=1 Tax=marine sediment metagenome TaxID=412755 RepID=X0Z0R5_9ZZZZ
MGKYIRVKLSDLKSSRYLSWSQEQLDIKQDIIDNYSPRIKPITISSDYKICDGNHRYNILVNHYGGGHKIIVKKQRYTKRMYDYVGLILGLILLLPFILYQLVNLIVKKLAQLKKVL